MSDYRFLLRPLPTGLAVLNSVVLHGVITAGPYRVVDFKESLERSSVIKDMEASRSFQMNHPWVLTLKSLAPKHIALAAGEILVKGKRCVILDPNCPEISVKVHWVASYISDDTIRSALPPYAKVHEIIREKWHIEGTAVPLR